MILVATALICTTALIVSRNVQRNREAASNSGNPEIQVSEPPNNPDAHQVATTNLPVRTLPPFNQILLRDPLPPGVGPNELSELRKVGAAAFSPDGSTLFTVQDTAQQNGSAAHVLQSWDLRTGKQSRRLCQQNASIKFPTVSADGRMFACFAGVEARVWDLAKGGEPTVIPLPADDRIQDRLFAIAHDGRTLIAAGKKFLYRIRIADGSIRIVPDLVLNESSRYAFSSFAPVLAVLASDKSSMSILDGDTWSKSTVALAKGDGPYDIAISGDGLTVAIVRLRTIDLWDLKTRTMKSTLCAVGERSIHGVSMSRDGRVIVALAYTSGDNHSARINIWAGPDLKPKELSLPGPYVPILSADGQTAAVPFSNGEFRLIDTASGNDLATVCIFALGELRQVR
jgi:WD40 repeat protein